MKSVLISQSIEDCIKIINGEKTMIKFSNAPKGTPFKVYIYCDTDRHPFIRTEHLVVNKAGKARKEGDNFYCNWFFSKNQAEEFYLTPTGNVFGEFICDRVYNIYEKTGGKPQKGWNISDFKIYDRCIELEYEDFYRPCPVTPVNCTNCFKFGKPFSIKYDERKRKIYCTRRVSEKPITFVYVEELKETPPIFHKELKDTNTINRGE